MSKSETQIFLRLSEKLKIKFKKMRKERGFSNLHQYLDYLLQNDEKLDLSEAQLSILDKIQISIISLEEKFEKLIDKVDYLEMIIQNSIIFSKDLKKIESMISS